MRFVGRFLEKGIKIYLVGRFLSLFFFLIFSGKIYVAKISKGEN